MKPLCQCDLFLIDKCTGHCTCSKVITVIHTSVYLALLAIAQASLTTLTVFVLFFNLLFSCFLSFFTFLACVCSHIWPLELILTPTLQLSLIVM